MSWIRVGGGYVKVEGTVWDTLKGGGTEDRRESKEFKLAQGMGALKGAAGTALRTMIITSTL